MKQLNKIIINNMNSSKTFKLIKALIKVYQETGREWCLNQAYNLASKDAKLLDYVINFIIK